MISGLNWKETHRCISRKIFQKETDYYDGRLHIGLRIVWQYKPYRAGNTRPVNWAEMKKRWKYDEQANISEYICIHICVLTIKAKEITSRMWERKTGNRDILFKWSITLSQ